MSGMDKPAKTGLKAYLAASGVCGLTVLLSLPLREIIDLANIILLFVLAVAAIAVVWGRGPAVLASFLSVACFNFFFVAPRFSFSVDDVQYLLTFGVMLAVSLTISYLSNAYRNKAQEAERRAGESALLHELAGDLSAALTLEQLLQLTVTFLQRRLNAGAALFIAGEGKQLQPLEAENSHSSLVEQMAAQGVYTSGASVGPLADLRDGVETMLFPLNGATRRRGVLAIHIDPEADLPDAGLLASVAALVATAVERIHYVEVANASELETQSVRLRNSILAAISHDIRTPLTVLYGLADSLAVTEELPDASRETAVALRTQSYRLHRMVDNLLDMARLKSGRVELRLDWQAIPEIVAASVQSLGPALAQHRLQLDWPIDLPLLKLDALLMERVFSNLLENAAKYSPSGSSISLGAESANGKLSVRIENQGPGFHAGRLAHVFDLFERGEAETAVPGVGLGLSICRTIVEAHGGHIEAFNVPGGAQVRITLPCTQMPEPPTESEAGL
jgi:two-component system, OmpR family, sensor histidine kinase KdpD